MKEQIHQCKDCRKYLVRGECPKAEYRDSKLNKIACLPSDIACVEFEPKKGGRRGARGQKGAKKDFKLDLDAEIPAPLSVCGFTGDVLTECAWLPYRNENGEVSLRPSVILLEKDQSPQIIDFLKQDRIKGTFPSEQLDSLMTPKGAKMVIENKTIDPQTVDSEIDEAIKKHLDVGEAERILIKRWIEGTYFYDVFDAFPLENILGVSESGKSRLCLLNLALCYHAEGLIDPTEATIFRGKEEDKVSLVIDEAEYLNDPKLFATLRILLNASYSKNAGYVSRYDESKHGQRVKKRFNLYSPLCVSGIGGLEGVTLSRAFRIVMKRTDKDFPKADSRTYRELRDKLYVLRINKAFEVHELYNKLDISNVATARFSELFKPLFTLTKIFGIQKEWDILSEWCRNYAENFRTEALNVAQEEMILVCLGKLENQNMDWFALKDLANEVLKEYGKPMTSRYVSRILHRLGITQRRKSHGNILFYAPTDLIEESAKRIGISFSSLSSPNSPSPPKNKPTFETAENWLESNFFGESKHETP